MSLNDPFGRKARRDESNFRSLRDSLRAAGVNDLAGAQRCLTDIRRNALRFGALIIAGALLVSVLLPAYIGPTITLAVLALFWLLATTLHGWRHVKRYIAEELSGTGSADRDE